MSPGAIAVTAIIVSGTQVTALIVAGAWLVHHQRILLAASPKPPSSPAPKKGADAAQNPQADDTRPMSITGYPSSGEVA